MKEYFSHDYNARNDTKLVKLFMKYGLSGVGAYWCIIEMLYEERGYLLRSEYERISFELRTEVKLIKSIVENFELFEKDNKKFWSETALNRLEQRMIKSVKARESVNKRWDKYKRNTNVKQSKNDSNTIKVKESKINKSKYKTVLLSELKNSDFDNPLYFEITVSFYELFKKNLKDAGVSTIRIEKSKGIWIDSIRLLIENDKYTIEDLRDVFKFLQINDFWKQNILSTLNLREKFDKLLLKARINEENKPINRQGCSNEELAEIIGKHFAINS